MDRVETGRHPRMAVEVVEREIAASGWREVDLAPASGGGREPSSGPPFAASGSIVCLAGRSEAALGLLASPGRIPPDAFVSVGPARPGSTGPRLSWSKVRPVGTANDNVAGHRSVWRDVFFLTLLFATVAGAFWSGRVQGLQRVIVVPGPSSFHSVVT